VSGDAKAESVLATLLSRRSVPAQLLAPPGPTPPQIERALDVALRAPDHGSLRPWRFVLIRGAARARLAALFERRMRERDPQLPPGKIEKARRRVESAALVIAVAAHVVEHPKVPELEQLLSSGAAVMNLLNAFHAQGLAAIWLTGENAYDREVAAELGFGAADRSLGFVYVGSAQTDAQRAAGTPGAPARPAPPPRTVPRELVIREWGA